MNEELKQRFFEQISEVYFTGRKMRDEVYNAKLDLYYSFMRCKLHDGVLTIIQDRNDQYIISGELKRQKTLLDNVLKYSPSGISVSKLIRDTDGTVVDSITILANDAAIQYVGLPKETYLSKSASEFNPAMLKTPLFQRAIQTLETGEPFQTQYYLELSDRWLELSVSKLDENHLISVFTDVTVTKKAQLELEEAAERLAAVFNTSQSGMFTFSPVRNDEHEIVDFRFVIANPTFAAYVKQTPEVLQGSLGSTYFPGYLTNGVFDMYKKTFNTGETQRADFHYNVDGLDLYLDLMSTKVGEEVLITFADFTQLKQAQQQLERSIEELKRSNASLEEFAHAASHDLKEPIRKVQIYAERLRNKLDARMDEAEKKLFESTESASRRMGLLVEDLLNYSLVTERSLQMEEINLEENLHSIQGDLELEIESRKATIIIDKMPLVKGYRRQLQQLFQNLIGNSLKYSKQGIAPVIKISSRIVAGNEVNIAMVSDAINRHYHLIEISDNGIGFEQKYSQHIFNIFKRLHAKEHYTGNGVGLSIARKVVQNHNGYIWAEAKPDEGSVFRILLPAD
jgi:signal transduction histidine kinase